MNSELLNTDQEDQLLKKEIFADKFGSILGRKPTEEEVNSLTQDDIYDVESRYLYIQEQKRQEAINDEYREKLQSDPSSIFYKDGELNLNIGTTVNDRFGTDKEYAYRRTKQLMHDYAKLSSAEQAVIDSRDRAEAIKRDSTLLTPDEARSLGNEYGVDLKYNKNVARGEAMFAINRNLYKRELEYAIADYHNEYTFSGLQKLGFMGSAISGGVGFYETALTIGLSWAIPTVGLSAVVKLGQMGKLSVDLARGLSIAYRTKRVADITRKASNVINSLSKIKKGEQTAENLVLLLKAKNKLDRGKQVAAKLKSVLDSASDTTRRAGKIANLIYRTPGAEDALTLGQRTILYASDAFASSVAPMSMSMSNSYLNQDDLYSIKNLAIESLFAAGIGGIIPVGGKALGFIGKVGVDTFSNIKKSVGKAIDDYVVNKTLHGYRDAHIKNSGKKATQGVDEVAKEFKQPHPDFVDMMSKFHDTNMSEEEFIANLKFVAQKLTNGEIPNISALPHKSMVLSHVASDIVNFIKKGDFSVIPEDLAAILTHVREKGIESISLKGETGLLGRKVIKTFSVHNAKDVTYNVFDILSDIYKIGMDNDVDAYLRVGTYVDNQLNLVNKLMDIVSTIGIDNIEKRGLITKEIGSLTYGENYARVLERLNELKEAGTVGKTFSKEELDALNDLYKKMHKDIDAIIEERNLFKKTGKGANDFELDQDSFFKFVQEIEEASQDLIELMNTDDLLKSKYGSADNLIEAINKYTEYTDTDLDFLMGIPRTSSEDLKGRLNNLETQQNLEQTYKQEWTVLSNSDDGEVDTIRSIFKNIDSKKQSDNNKDAGAFSFFTKCEEAIRNIDDFLHEGILKMQQDLKTAFSDEDMQSFFVRILNMKKEKNIKRGLLRSKTSAIRKMINTHVAEPLAKIGVVIDESEIVALADRFIETINEGKAKSLLFSEGEGIIDTLLPEEEMLQGVETSVNRKIVVNRLIEPLLVEAQRLALNNKVQKYNSLIKLTNVCKELQKNPYVPGEVIVKLFTFSPYNLDKANLNIENIVRNSQAFVRDIENTLKRKSSGTTGTEKILDEGIDLVEYMNNPENRKGILTALTYLEHFGSADAAKKAGVPFNSNDAVIAQTIRDTYSTLLNNLTNVGSLRQKVGNRFNLSKLRQADRFIPESEIQDVQTAFSTIINQIDGLETPPDLLVRFKEIYNSLFNVDASIMGDHSKAVFFAFKHFDLDRMFNSKGLSEVDYNDVRDMILSGNVLEHMNNSSGKEFKNFIDAFEGIKDALTGRPTSQKLNKKGEIVEVPFMKGWIGSFLYKTDNFTDIKNNLTNRYVANFKDTVTFKDVESELKALDYLGYDSIADQLNHDFETCQRAYAVLKTTGSEPIKLAEDAMEFVNMRVASRSDLFPAGSAKLSSAIISDTARNSILANAAMAAGVDTAASRSTTRWFKVISDFFSSPLLVNAGFSSLTDFTYQQEWMMLNGLIESKNLAGWTKGVKCFADIMQDKELGRIVGYNLYMTQDAILRMRTNVDTDSVSLASGIFGNINEMIEALTTKKGTKLDRAERFVKAYSSMMINDIGLTDKFTQNHRSSAALLIMKGISSQADTAFETMVEKNPGLANLLKRHGISGDDWDFLRTHCNIEFNDFLVNSGIKNSTLARDFKLFIPDNLLNVSDDVFIAEMKKRKLNPNNKILFDSFRNELYEKASILINSSADEMTTLPTYRTTNAMSLGKPQSSGTGQFLQAFTKFQSFGMACTQIHFGRRIAQLCDTEDAANIQTIWRVLLGRAGVAKAFESHANLAHLVLTTAMAQLMVSEAKDYAKGQHQGYFDSEGKFNWADKVVDPIISSTGFPSLLLDATVGKFARGNFTSEGFAVTAFPSVSTLYRDTKRLAKPFVDDELTFGEKVKESSAAFAGIMSEKFSVSNSVFTSLVWQQAIGAWLEEQEKGAADYRRNIRAKQREGYKTDTWYSRYQTEPKLLGVID